MQSKYEIYGVENYNANQYLLLDKKKTYRIDCPFKEEISLALSKDR